MNPLHDIRDQMPKFSANFFPPYVYQPYPRMMVNKETGKPYLDSAKNPIAVHSEEEEAAFWATKKVPTVAEAAKVIEIPIAAVALPVVRQQFEALTPKQAEKAAAANETVAPPKRRGRPPSLPKDLK